MSCLSTFSLICFSCLFLFSLVSLFLFLSFFSYEMGPWARLHALDSIVKVFKHLWAWTAAEDKTRVLAIKLNRDSWSLFGPKMILSKREISSTGIYRGFLGPFSRVFPEPATREELLFHFGEAVATHGINVKKENLIDVEIILTNYLLCKWFPPRFLRKYSTYWPTNVLICQGHKK